MLRPEPTSLPGDALYFLRELASRIKNQPRRVATRTAAAKIHRTSGTEPAVNYGRAAPAPGTRLPIGGEIKLIPLRERFPEQFISCNLVYLVSSALPADAIEVVTAARSAGAKLVWNQNGVAYPGCYGNFYPWFNRPMAALYRMADHVIFQSEFCRSSAERYLGPCAVPCEILFNPVDTAQFCPPATARNAPVWRLLAAGTSHAFYRTRSTIDTLCILIGRGHRARLTIAGELRWRGAMRETAAYIRNAGVAEHVEFLPPFRQEQAPELYRAADVLLHTKDKDPCPTVPIEAMACGVPVVGLASGGMPELVPPDCGVLCPVEQRWDRDLAADPHDLASAIEHILADRGPWSARARAHAQQAFCRNKWLDRHSVLFRSLLT